MVRGINEGTLDALEEGVGIEPINIIGIKWSTTTPLILYADKHITDVEGRLLELSNLNNVIRIDSAGTAGTIHIVLDDSDGILKQIYDNNDIHKRPVYIYQGFIVNNILDKFIIFEGQIASPIVWSETERTLSFDVTNKIEDREVGFSPEDGQFDNLDLDQVGKAWPLCFGYAQLVPIEPLLQPPAGLILTPFGYVDPGIKEQYYRLVAQYQALDDVGPPTLVTIPPGSTEEQEQSIRDAAVKAREAFDLQVYRQRQEITKRMNDLIFLEADQRTWMAGGPHSPDGIFVTLEEYPAGKCIVRLNETIMEVSFEVKYDANNNAVSAKINVPTYLEPLAGDYTFYPRTITIDDDAEGANKQGFLFFNVGTPIVILSETNIPYVVNCIEAEIEGVYAYRSFDGIKKLSKVPSRYYVVKHKGLGSGGWLETLQIILKRPLSIVSYLENKARVSLNKYIEDMKDKRFPQQSKLEHSDDWEDDLYVSMYSSVGPNIVNIIIWLIENFTEMDYDLVSFGHVRNKLAYLPAHFCLFERKNIITLLNEIAVQTQCAIWIKEGIFYIRYLPEEPVSIDTITEDDVKLGSLQLTSTETEEVITKYTGIYKLNYLKSTKENKVIVRHNVAKYGIQEEVINFYIYSNHAAIKRVLSFWLIRKAYTWKKIIFKTFPHKLNLETMDCVTINFTHNKVANSTIKGIIESSVYNSQDNDIEMVVWLPIPLGQMTQYRFAWPSGISSIFAPVPGTEVGVAGVFHAYTPSIFPAINFGNVSARTEEKGGKFDERHIDGKPKRVVSTFGYPDEQIDKYVGDNGIALQSNFLNIEQIPDLEDIPKYDYELRDVQGILNLEKDSSSVYPGKITEFVTSSRYKVRIFKKGSLDENDSEIVEVFQLQIIDGESLPDDTWVLVAEVKGAYYMQAPVWM